MFVTRLEIEGLRHAEHRTVESPDRTITVGAGAEGGAVLDALDLFAAALAPVDLVGLARRLGWDGPATAIEGAESEPELAGLVGAAVGGIVADGARDVRIAAEIALDPPLYGRLREHAVRDPRMVTALGQRPAVVVKAGWLFNRDRSVAQPTVLALRIGDVGFDTAGKERPPWLLELCADLGRRFARTDPTASASTVAERLFAASVSPEVHLRSGHARLVDVVSRPPFGFPPVGLVRFGERLSLVFGPDLTPVRQIGRHALDAVRLCEGLFLRRPDVLAVDEPVSSEVSGWLAALVEGPDAPVEQVWLR